LLIAIGENQQSAIDNQQSSEGAVIIPVRPQRRTAVSDFLM
jgi:hypothetical protein